MRNPFSVFREEEIRKHCSLASRIIRVRNSSMNVNLIPIPIPKKKIVSLLGHES